MRGLMERFGAAVENAPAVFDRYADAPVEGERDVAGLDEGNKIVAVARMCFDIGNIWHCLGILI